MYYRNSMRILKSATLVTMLLYSICIYAIRPSNQMDPALNGSKYVVFKFDDLKETNWKQWKVITDIIIEKDITADLGIFVQSLVLGDEDYLAYIQSLVDDPEHFQLWFHGWTGTSKEFFDSDYGTQLEHFYLARTTMLMKYDYILRVYSPHYYGVNEHTVKIVNEDPFIKSVIYRADKGYTEEKQGLTPHNLRMEPKTGIVSYDHYLANWAKISADTLSYIVLQGHPWGYRTDSLKSNLVEIANDLLDKGFTFTHLTDYRRMIKGYSTDTTSPSVPRGLKVSMIDDSQVNLSWDPSEDAESGVDCYKIYRDGICIDLSDKPGYTDSISGSHNYQIAAVNNNDLVSERSRGSKDLPRNRAGLESVEIDGITDYLDAVSDEEQELHSLMVVRNGKVVFEQWFGENGPDKNHVMHSVSKTFTSMAMGFAVQEGLLAIDDKVVSFFPADLPGEPSPWLLDLEIRDLLTMTVGHNPLSLQKIKTNKDSWEQLFLAQPILHEPGTVFAYNSVATYILSAIIQEVSEKTLLEYLQPRLLGPLGIYGVEWEESPTGVNTGGWGLHIKTEDMAKLGQFLLQKGKWDGKQVLSEQWIEEACSVKVKQRPFWVSPEADLDESDWGQGYGYQIWRNRPGGFRADGAKGQYIIVLPEKEAVIVTTANISDTQAELNLIWEYVLPAIE